MKVMALPDEPSALCRMFRPNTNAESKLSLVTSICNSRNPISLSNAGFWTYQSCEESFSIYTSKYAFLFPDSY